MIERDCVTPITSNADASSATVAALSMIRDRLEAAGYVRTEGNRYERGDRVIDLLVPSHGSRMSTTTIDGLRLDAVPGLTLAFALDPIVVHLTVMALDDSTSAFDVRLPTVECALVLKAGALERLASKDVYDMACLLEIVHAHGDEAVGGWSMRDAPLTGSRLDAARSLHGLADRAISSGVVAESGVDAGRLAALIREHVHRPGS